MGNGCRRPAAVVATGSDARAPTHRFEFEINGQKYSLETVISDVEIETEPPCQLFGVIPHAVDVPLKEGDEVLNFTICLLGLEGGRKVIPRLSAKDFVGKLDTRSADGEGHEVWADWEKTGRSSIRIAGFDINACEVPGSGYDHETVISDVEIETEPPCQLFGVIPHAVDVPLKEGDEVLNFTICLLGLEGGRKVIPRLSAKDFLGKLDTSYAGSTSADGEVREVWADWEKTGRSSIRIAGFDINACEVPGSGYDREDET
ncbi:unnamed protein product [Symbiodinium sp. CCMP2592]|nr:unnamed protein product [Symbiodinium sp. CCMP2592]